MDKIYYLYRHIRLDKNEPFYIGIGYYNLNQSYKSKFSNYRRAYSKYERNSYWNHLTNLTNYTVDIMLESKNLEFIRNKEIEFIKLYGRKDLGIGTLVNMTDGGEGCFGCIPSEYAKLKSSEKHSIPVYQYSIDNKFIKKWKSAINASLALNITSSNIIKCVKNKAFHAGNFLWKSDIMNEIPNKKYIIKNKAILQQTLSGEFIKKWNSAKEIENTLNFNASSITKCCKNKLKTMYKFKWKYYEQDNVNQIV